MSVAFFIAKKVEKKLKKFFQWDIRCPIGQIKSSHETWKGGEDMQSAVDRRQSLLELMCERRHETIDNLAFEFEVDRRTIRRDIEVLSISYPIYTTKGTGGGVHVVDGYRLGRKYLSETESDLLEKLASKLTGDDFATMQSILKKFKEPRR